MRLPLRPRTLSTYNFPGLKRAPNAKQLSYSRINSSATAYAATPIPFPANTRYLRRRTLLAIASVTFLGATTVGLIDGKRIYYGVQRASRVAITLALCINDYRVTLKRLENDPDDEAGLLGQCHKRCAERTFTVMEKNGSVFIKLGQHLAAMGYLLPTEWTETFIPLQDRCPVSSFESIEQMILDDTGYPLSELFASFEPTPIGAASLAQVHRATLPSGEQVAVKLQHPSLSTWTPLDLALTRWTFTNIKWFFPEYPMTWLSDEMEASLPKELNFECEAANITRVRDYFSSKNYLLIIPNVIWAKPRILVMEYIPGKRLDDLEHLDSHNISRDEVSASLTRIFNEMIFGHDAPLHCDPHGGNLAIRFNPLRSKPTNFDIILYDHGLYRDIPTDIRRSYAKLWLAVLDADVDRMKRYAKEVAGITEEQFPLFASAITGRDYSVLTQGITMPRNAEEKKHIAQAMSEGLLGQLIQLLANVPSIILLILKTNDLTRSLDENLQTGHGPERGFMIMARYCSKCVYEETVEEISKQGGLLRLGNLVKYLGALLDYWRVGMRIRTFELFLYWRSVLSLAS